jgi:hypothetical protein
MSANRNIQFCTGKKQINASLKTPYSKTTLAIILHDLRHPVT